MKKAKVTKGIVRRVYPDSKGNPMPPMPKGAADLYIDVPDYVKPGFVWDEKKKKFGPIVKVYPKVCREWGVKTGEEWLAEYLRRKAAKAD